MTEQQIQKKIITYLEKQGCYVVKVITASKAGVPDLLACCGGQFYGLEVKTPIGRPSKLQLANVAKIVTAGGVAKIARSVDDVKEVLGES